MQGRCYRASSRQPALISEKLPPGSNIILVMVLDWTLAVQTYGPLYREHVLRNTIFVRLLPEREEDSVRSQRVESILTRVESILTSLF